jgi:hypothetical protein
MSCAEIIIEWALSSIIVISSIGIIVGASFIGETVNRKLVVSDKFSK